MSGGLPDLLDLIDEFHITDRALLRARDRVRRDESAAAVEALRQAAAKYFNGMANEAEQHLRELDGKLDDLYQRQYNLQAERGVAERRRDGARRVLQSLDDATPQARS